MNVSFDLQSAALAKRRSELARAATESTDEDVAALKREQAALAGARERALRELDGAADRIVAGPPRFLAHALALPPLPDSELGQMDERVEAVAVRVAVQAEADRGADVQDVSSPEKARAAGLSDWPGFDLLSRYPGGKVRSIEVKGPRRAGRGANGAQRMETGVQPGRALLALRGVRLCDTGAAALSGAGSVSESPGVEARCHGVHDNGREHRQGSGRGDAFLREGALMAQSTLCSTARMPGPETMR